MIEYYTYINHVKTPIEDLKIGDYFYIIESFCDPVTGMPGCRCVKVNGGNVFIVTRRYTQEEGTLGIDTDITYDPCIEEDAMNRGTAA